MSDKKLYTQEQLDIAVLQNTNSGILATLQRLEQKIDSNFHCTLNLMFGVYAIGITGLIGALGHVYNWF